MVPRNKTPGRSPSKSPKPKKRASSQTKKTSPKTSPKKSSNQRKSVSPKRSPSPGKKIKSVEEGGDVLDKFIDTVSIPGMFAILAGVCAVGYSLFGSPGDGIYIHICSLVLGMGRGGVPGAATVAAAFFVLLAPAGFVNKMLALMTVAESMPNWVVGAAYYKSADWMFAMKLNLFTTVGLAAGAYLAEVMPDIYIRKFAGLVLLSVVGQMTYQKIEAVKKSGNLKGGGDGKAKTTTNGPTPEFLRSYTILVPLGVIGGILSYVAGNMGPLLNVYLVMLALPKYEMVGTRAAIFIPIDLSKQVSRYLNGDLTIPDFNIADWFSLEYWSQDSEAFYASSDSSTTSMYNLFYGIRLGIVGIMGVLVAKIWLKKASKELFSFVYERVTYVMTALSGLLLVTGMSMTDIIKGLTELLR